MLMPFGSGLIDWFYTLDAAVRISAPTLRKLERRLMRELVEHLGSHGYLTAAAAAQLSSVAL